MEDTRVVGGIDRAGDLIEEGKRLRERQGTREGLPSEELRDDVGDALRAVDCGIGDLDDVGVPEASERYSLPAEALESGGGRRSGRLQKLDREGLLQADVDRAVDDSDGAFSEAFLQSVLLTDEAPGGCGDGLWNADDRLLLRCYILRSI
jgi:hypothetical protein